MRIGILTFHSQLNYGGVLQAWALREALAGFEAGAAIGYDTAGFEAGAAIGYDTAALEAARAQSRDWLRAALG